MYVLNIGLGANKYTVVTQKCMSRSMFNNSKLTFLLNVISYWFVSDLDARKDWSRLRLYWTHVLMNVSEQNTGSIYIVTIKFSAAKVKTTEKRRDSTGRQVPSNIEPCATIILFCLYKEKHRKYKQCICLIVRNFYRKKLIFLKSLQYFLIT